MSIFWKKVQFKTAKANLKKKSETSVCPVCYAVHSLLVNVLKVQKDKCVHVK